MLAGCSHNLVARGVIGLGLQRVKTWQKQMEMTRVGERGFQIAQHYSYAGEGRIQSGHPIGIPATIAKAELDEMYRLAGFTEGPIKIIQI